MNIFSKVVLDIWQKKKVTVSNTCFNRADISILLVSLVWIVVRVYFYRYILCANLRSYRSLKHGPEKAWQGFNVMDSVLLVLGPWNQVPEKMVKLTFPLLFIRLPIINMKKENVFFSWSILTRRSSSVNSYAMFEPNGPYFNFSSRTPWNKHSENNKCLNSPVWKIFINLCYFST